MPQKICCVSSCKSSLQNGAILHSFPNPLKELEKFRTWVKNAGIDGEDDKHIFANRRICHLHFNKIYHYPKNRLSKLAIPTLHLPDVPSSYTAEPMDVCEQQPPTYKEIYCGPNTSAPQPTSKRPQPMTMDDQQPSTSTMTYTGVTRSAPQPTSKRPQPMTMDDQQPSTSTMIYTGVTRSAPQPTSKRPPPMTMDDQQAASKQPSTRTHSGVIRSHMFKNQFEQDLYKAVAKTQAELRRCKKAKAGLIQKLQIAKKLTRSKAYQYVTKDLSPAAKTFFDMQIRQSTKHPKGHRFTLDEKILALSLYKPSPKAYRLLSQICVLPKKTTLNKLMTKTYLMPGINDIIFNNLKKRVEKMPSKHRYCSIIFDEMAIAAHVAFDKHTDKIKGFEDDGFERERKFADHVLVFMVRGVFKKFKQPVAYSFCTGSTKTEKLKRQLKTVIENVLATGLKVISTTCDQGSTNMAAINSLINDTKGHYIRQNQEFKGGFFEINEHKIYPLYDPPHLLKGIRINLITKNLEFTLNGKKRTAKWAHLEALYKKGPSYKGMRLIPKLTARHVIPNLIPKMKVKYCTELFSKTVSVAMGFTAGTGRIPKEAQDTAEILLFFDNLFDSVNGSYNRIEKGKVYRSAVSPKSPHHKLWYKSLPILKSMQFVGGARSGVVPSLRSWIKTIEAFQQITKKLHSIGLKSLLLRNFNQDPLENFFGAIRAHGHRNIMPTVPAFEASYKALLINNMVSPKSIGANCESDDGYCLQNLKYLFYENIVRPLPKNIIINFDHINMDLTNIDNLIKSQNPLNIEKCAAAAYCSGWVIKTIYKNIGYCEMCKSDLEGDGEEIYSKFITMKKYSEKCNLHYPNKHLLECLLHIEEITLLILSTQCESDQISEYIKLVTTSLVTLNFVTCESHKEKVKELIICKGISLMINDWCKEINNILNGKNIVFDENCPMKMLAHRYFVSHKSKNKSFK
ncbi:uncharacterized protein LOC135077445 isoform X1 [Ostrinia nubilalis]|uniref:uncharacterized protein LOC135074201 isoform X1 n=1 Tax=Ostrinia nubilalis TaxID=29057 RepID=UPI0030823913